MFIYKYKKNARYIKELIYHGEVMPWARCSGCVGAVIYILLRHRYTLDKSKTKDFVTLPKELRECFGIGTKVLKRARAQLIRAGLLQIKRNDGRPYQYKIAKGENLED